MGQFQGLLVPELGVIIDGKPKRKSSFFLDLSIDVQIYDIYNLQFAPTNFSIKKAYLRHKTDFSSRVIEKLQSFSASLVYDLNKDWQIKGNGLLSNTYNKDNQINENIQETSIITEFKYKF